MWGYGAWRAKAVAGSSSATSIPQPIASSTATSTTTGINWALFIAALGSFAHAFFSTHTLHDVLLAMLQQASQVEFEPAKNTPTGDPVAVSMVWVLANTTVKGRPTDDVILIRRPPAATPAVDRLPAAPKPTPVGLNRPATDEGFLS